MTSRQSHDLDDEARLLNNESTASRESGSSLDSLSRSASSISTMSLVLENMNNQHDYAAKPQHYKDDERPYKDEFQEFDIEDERLHPAHPVDARYKKWLYIVGSLCLAGWLLALALFILSGTYKHRSTLAHNPDATSSLGAGKKITLDQVMSGQWAARWQDISWINGPDKRDGLVLETGGSSGLGYLVVEDIRASVNDSDAVPSMVLMQQSGFRMGGRYILAEAVWPSPDLRKVLVMSHREKNWRHSYTGEYYLFDVATQQGVPLDPASINGRVQLATWSPTSDAVVFTRDNDMFLRFVDDDLKNTTVQRITTSGGVEMFNGVPDWVYEEEVFGGNSATWWSPDGRFIAYLATNETGVPEYPIEYFVSRPDGIEPAAGEENYPEERYIKYPKAGAHNPVVYLRLYSLEDNEAFSVSVEDDFPDDDRLITEVVWAGESGKVLIRQTNRESDFLKMVLIDVGRREGKIVRTQDVNKLDGGWFEISETTTFVPGDPANGRPHDGYIDTIIHEGYDHLAYFTPLDNPTPIILTSGKWEVVEAPSAVDTTNNIVYFVATKESSIQRHVYMVDLDGSRPAAITDISREGYYSVSFSTGAGFALLSYRGPDVPWQEVISTPSNPKSFTHVLEENKDLARKASEYELPLKIYSTVTIDGFSLNVLERRPPHFDKNKKYPVLFYLYGGPGSQSVDKHFTVDFQSFVAANMGYIVVTVDGRGTGFIGRQARCIIRGNLGYWEAHDQIETAKIWGKKSYVDESRLAIWGWSYGGYMTLKTLEQDAGQTFKYGMAVAPVTDWRFYGEFWEAWPVLTRLADIRPDTIYTERWMLTPQHNAAGYDNASISNVTALGQNTRFLLMHGVADDNVHFQNSLTLLDKLDLAGIENYDVHVFPDSDHSIYFHNANKIVYDKLSWWLINAFNGEWARIEHAVPLRAGSQVGTG